MPADETDIIKAGADAFFAPVRDVMNRLLGPAVDELGGILADPIRVVRWKQTTSLLRKLKMFEREQGFISQEVPLKTLLPLLEHASLEQDEALHDRWASLLANAASGRIPNDFGLTCVEILRCLSATDVMLLDTLYDKVKLLPKAITSRGRTRLLARHDFGDWDAVQDVFEAGLRKLKVQLGRLSKSEIERAHALSLDNLLRQGLVWRKSVKGESESGGSMNHYFLTAIAFEFVTACCHSARPERNSKQ